jgi:hypothetical protein
VRTLYDPHRRSDSKRSEGRGGSPALLGISSLILIRNQRSHQTIPVAEAGEKPQDVNLTSGS